MLNETVFINDRIDEYSSLVDCYDGLAQRAVNEERCEYYMIKRDNAIRNMEKWVARLETARNVRVG